LIAVLRDPSLLFFTAVYVSLDEAHHLIASEAEQATRALAALL
jgi:hypothetical protein